MYQSEGRKSVIKTFRLDPQVGNLLSKVTRQRNVTESSYVSSVLKKALLVEPVAHNIGVIELNKFIFEKMLDQMNLAELEMMASDLARANVGLILDLLGLGPNLSDVNKYVCEILQQWNWFEVEITHNEMLCELKIFHNFGEKWSIFLKSYLSMVYKSILGDAPTISLSERVVKVVLSEKTIFELNDYATIRG